MTTWAFIPARDESTHFPKKNSAHFMGKPLVVWAVEIAREAQRIGLIDQILVVTERWTSGGVEPALREHKITDDPAGGLWVLRRPEPLCAAAIRVIDLLRYYLSNDRRVESVGPADPPDAVCVLLPTSPLRTIRHLVESYRLLRPGLDVVLSVTPFRQDIRGMVTWEKDAPGRISVCDTQGWPDVQYLKHDGASLWVTSEYARSNLATKEGFYGGELCGYLIPPGESADIDTPLDLEWAEFLAARRKR